MSFPNPTHLDTGIEHVTSGPSIWTLGTLHVERAASERGVLVGLIPGVCLSLQTDDEQRCAENRKHFCVPKANHIFTESLWVALTASTTTSASTVLMRILSFPLCAASPTWRKMGHLPLLGCMEQVIRGAYVVGQLKLHCRVWLLILCSGFQMIWLIQWRENWKVLFCFRRHEENSATVQELQLTDPRAYEHLFHTFLVSCSSDYQVGTGLTPSQVGLPICTVLERME